MMTDEAATAENQDLFSTRILTKYIEEHTRDVCQHLTQAPFIEVEKICAQLPDTTCARLLAQLPDTVSDHIIANADDEQLSRWLAMADPDDAIAIAFRTSTQRRDRLLGKPKQNRLVIERLNSLHQNKLGALLRVDFLRVNIESSREEIIDELKRRGGTAHRAVFVCEINGKYSGTIEWHKALTAEPQAIGSELSRRVQPLMVTASIEQVSKAPQWRTHRELPVVDERFRLIGSLLWSDLQTHLANKTSGRGQQSNQIFSLLGSLEFTTVFLKKLVDLLAGHRGRP